MSWPSAALALKPGTQAKLIVIALTVDLRPIGLAMIKQIDPERRKELRTKALEHLEAARACLDETGDGVATYLVERTIDEVPTQLYAGLDPFSENWPAKKAR